MSSTELTTLSSPLIWLKSEIDHSLGEARTALSQSVSEPGSSGTNLGSCENQVRQVRGAVTILGLDGAARFCQALEAVVRRYAESAARLTQVTASLIDRGMFALSQFLDDIAKGEMDVPLKLFPLYRELSELCGRTEVLEIELFFPDIGVAPPPHSAARVIAAADVPRYVTACRAHYQRFLLLWVEQPNKPDGLHGMRAALDTLDQIAPQLATPAGFWWAAVGLVEVVIQCDARALELPVKSIFERIERLMQDLESGTTVDCSALMREILYPLALSAPVSRRVRDAKQMFQLDQQLPEFCVSGTLEYDLGAMAPALDDMRQRLSSLEDAWVFYTSGGANGLKRLRDETGALKNIARDLGFYRLLRVLDVIVLIGSKLPEPYPSGNEVLTLELAAALLFVERIIDQIVSPPPDLDEQVTVMVQWLLDAINARASGTAGPGVLRDDITQREFHLQVRAQVAREIQENLRRVEQTIDQIARGSAPNEEILDVDTQVRQISGALTMLSLSRANGVLSSCRHLMKLSVSGDVSLTHASLELVADGLSCLGFYLDRLQLGAPPDEENLIRFLQQLGLDDTRPADSVGSGPAESEAAQSASTEPAGDKETAPVDDSAQIESEPVSIAEPADRPGLDDTRPVDSAGSGPAESEAAQSASTEPAVGKETAPVDDGAQIESEPVPIAEPVVERTDRTSASQNDELRAVYVDESLDVLASLAPTLERLGVAPEDHEALTEVRRGFHTLKGSGRLVGLDTLGELAGEIETTLNHWLELAAPATADLLALIGSASETLLIAAQEIETGGAPDASGYPELVAQARRLRDELGSPAEPL